MHKIELLSPAKNFDTGKAAIEHGADAVYIGAAKFGARKAAANALGQIHSLTEYAHKYWAKVYVTLNTVLYDNELEEAQQLVCDVHSLGADAIIIQDYAFLKMDIPPIPIFSSTQMNNLDIPQIQFLEQCGFQRVILGRELSLDTIREIRAATSIKLESFIHGALCVCYSGRCYLSLASTGRSANRGECSQPCRLEYSLIDANQNVIIKDKHLLSLKDLNLSEYLAELIDAGITSFKIEGRLKDIGYVKNITAFYRDALDEILKTHPEFKRSSSGTTELSFTPDPEKTFNRGYTEYFINGRSKAVSSYDTPKSKGKYIGKVISCGKGFVDIENGEALTTGDGICFSNEDGKLDGTYINKIAGRKIFSDIAKKIRPGTEIFRNHDHRFEKILNGKSAERRIDVNISISDEHGKLIIHAQDEDDVNVTTTVTLNSGTSGDKDILAEKISKQFSRSGTTIYRIRNISVHLTKNYLISIAQINETRRRALSSLVQERKLHFPRLKISPHDRTPVFPKSNADHSENITNKLSQAFFGERGVGKIEPGLEVTNQFEGRKIFTSKYCILDEIGKCLRTCLSPEERLDEPLYIKDRNYTYRLFFDCQKCEMALALTGAPKEKKEKKNNKF